MANGNVHLPLAEIPEELEKAEVEVLLEYLRENHAWYAPSVLRELALAAGYRASVVERAIQEFEGEPRPAPEPEPEPPPVRVEKKKPLPAAVPAPPAPPPPKAPVFLETFAETEQAAQAEPAPAERRASPWLALLIVALNAAVLSLVFTGDQDMALFFYIVELALAFLLGGLGKIHAERLAQELQGERLASRVQTAAPVRSEPDRTAVPTLPHEAGMETPQKPGVPTRKPSRR